MPRAQSRHECMLSLRARRYQQRSQMVGNRRRRVSLTSCQTILLVVSHGVSRFRFRTVTAVFSSCLCSVERSCMLVSSIAFKSSDRSMTDIVSFGSLGFRGPKTRRKVQNTLLIARTGFCMSRSPDKSCGHPIASLNFLPEIRL